MGQLTFGVGYLILYLLAGATLDRNGLALSLFGNAAVVCSAALVILTINRRRRHWAGCQRLFWDTFAAGMAIWILGHIGWSYAEIVGPRPGWLAWHTVFSLSGGAAPLLALVARPQRGVRQHATGAVGVDVASYGLLTGFVYAYFVLIPDVTNGAVATGALLTSVQVFRFVLMGGMCTAAFVTRKTAWGPTYRRLAIGVTIGAVLRMATSSAIADGRYHVGTFYDFAWIVPYLFYAWAASEAPASPDVAETDDAEDRPSGLTFAMLSAMPVLLIPAIGYAAAPLVSADPEAASFRALLTGMATVGGLGLLTLRLLVQRGQLKRADAWARLLAAATEQTGDLILIARADGSVEYANDAFQRAVGFNRRELSSLKFPQPLETPPRDVPRPHSVRAPQSRRLARYAAPTPARRFDVRLRPALSSRCATVTARSPTSSRSSVTSTEELRLRDQLVHSERLSAVGELVAGVAHEINNPLQAIVGCVELLLDDHADRALMRRDLEIVRREAGRAGHIVRNLLSFVRRTAPDRVRRRSQLPREADGGAPRIPPPSAEHQPARAVHVRNAARAGQSRGNPAGRPEPAPQRRAGHRVALRARNDHHPHHAPRGPPDRRCPRRRAGDQAGVARDGSSNRSSRRRKSARAPDSACRSRTASPPRTAARSRRATVPSAPVSG